MGSANTLIARRGGDAEHMTRGSRRLGMIELLSWALGTLAACSPRERERPSIVVEDVQEVAFRYLMREYSPEATHRPAAVLCLRQGKRRLSPALEAYRRDHPPDPDKEVGGPMHLLGDMPSPFLQRFASHEPAVVPGSRCAPPEGPAKDRWTDRETGRPAIVYAVSDPELLPGDQVLVAVEYHVGGRHAGGGVCVLARSGGEWKVSRCRNTWVS